MSYYKIKDIEHLGYSWNNKGPEECLHNRCECRGKGRKGDGTICVHMISCPCPKCSPRY